VNVLLKGDIARVSGSGEPLSVYAAPTEAFHGLTPPKPVVWDEKEGVRLEAREFCVRALECEPELLRLLWMPLKEMEIRTPLGDQLLGIKESFLSAQALIKTYSRSMDIQVGQLLIPSNQKAAARELYRLGHEALHFHSFGRIMYDVDVMAEGDFVREVVSGNDQFARDYAADVETSLREQKTALSDEPRIKEVESWLSHVRARYFMRT
jgi:hypothetical protein